MTTVEYLQGLLERARREHGEDAFSTQHLREQIASLKRRRNQSTESMFLIGSKARDHEARLKQEE
jgi:hypothetical protein